MKTILTVVASAAALMGASASAAQTAQGAPASDTPILGVAEAAPDCGNLYALAGRAFCVTAPLAAVGQLAETYIAHFQSQGWLTADGDQNRIIFVKRRDGGGCDGMQMIAFYDTSRPQSPELPGYIGFATIPGNVCADEASGPAAGPPAS